MVNFQIGGKIMEFEVLSLNLSFVAGINETKRLLVLVQFLFEWLDLCVWHFFIIHHNRIDAGINHKLEMIFQ
jgi:hypothetical protein